ncbi:hypothetical protein GWI33_013289 [Rhynchophorus ferrugineus]|uniref:RING-type domain-containing protein n=1 Tax=Rhynchophorus ferrugineus TaxID=354439 RepID=A0A834I417_RHYFE|nr:hypothetical protein GWI33_013289 [Rhynchophorus ferrugineus]
MEGTQASGRISRLLHPGVSPALLNDDTLHVLSEWSGIEYEVFSVLANAESFDGNNFLQDMSVDYMELLEDDEAFDLVLRDELDSLETLLFDKNSSDGQMSCVICLEDFREHETIKKLPCNHTFHINCIDHWLKINGTCPLCRSDINLWLMGRQQPDG